MYLNLFDNAVDSMQQAKLFYKQYLDNENKFYKQTYGTLKLTIICLQISIEVFMKKILSEVSELLIYNEENIDKIIKDISFEIKNEQKYSLNESIMRRDIDVKTINYMKCLNRINEIFVDIESEHIENLKYLGYLRNQIVHFGIDRQFDYYKIIRIINRAFGFFNQFIYPRYTDELNSLYLEISELIAYGELYEKEAWTIFHEYALVGIEEFINELYLIFKEKLLANNINIEVFKEYNEGDMYTISDIGFFDIEEEYVYLGISIKTIIELDSTYLIINDVNDMSNHELTDSVFAIIDHSKVSNSKRSDVVYICKSINILKSEEYKFQKIKNDSSKNNFLNNSKKWFHIDFDKIIKQIKREENFKKDKDLENIITGYCRYFRSLFKEDWNELNKNRQLQK